MKTLLETLRDRERDLPDTSYACYRVGHVIDTTGLCLCCLKQIVFKDTPPT